MRVRDRLQVTDAATLAPPRGSARGPVERRQRIGEQHVDARERALDAIDQVLEAPAEVAKVGKHVSRAGPDSRTGPCPGGTVSAGSAGSVPSYDR